MSRKNDLNVEAELSDRPFALPATHSPADQKSLLETTEFQLSRRARETIVAAHAEDAEQVRKVMTVWPGILVQDQRTRGLAMRMQIRAAESPSIVVQIARFIRRRTSRATGLGVAVTVFVAVPFAIHKFLVFHGAEKLDQLALEDSDNADGVDRHLRLLAAGGGPGATKPKPKKGDVLKEVTAETARKDTSSFAAQSTPIRKRYKLKTPQEGPEYSLDGKVRRDGIVVTFPAGTEGKITTSKEAGMVTFIGARRGPHYDDTKINIEATTMVDELAL